jgi:hypothetical protein
MGDIRYVIMSLGVMYFFGVRENSSAKLEELLVSIKESANVRHSENIEKLKMKHGEEIEKIHDDYQKKIEEINDMHQFEVGKLVDRIRQLEAEGAPVPEVCKIDLSGALFEENSKDN